MITGTAAMGNKTLSKRAAMVNTRIDFVLRLKVESLPITSRIYGIKPLKSTRFNNTYFQQCRELFSLALLNPNRTKMGTTGHVPVKADWILFRATATSSSPHQGEINVDKANPIRIIIPVIRRNISSKDM